MIRLMFTTLKAYVGHYAKGKTWYWYVPMWLFGLYLFMKLLSFELGGQLPFVIAVPQAFDFMLHETAHVMFGFAPDIVTAAAGSLAELLLGLLLIWGAFKGRTYFASLFGFLWFMLACQSVADYIADARTQYLPLVSLGDLSGSGAIHDWQFILAKLNMLGSDTAIAGLVRFVGTVAGVLGLAFSAWVIYMIAGAKQSDELNQKEAELLHQAAAQAGIHAAPPKHFKDLKNGAIYPDAIKGRLSEEEGYRKKSPPEKQLRP